MVFSLLRQRRFRPLLGLTALLWIWGAVAREAHTASVRHVTCPEHGEVTEIRGAAAEQHDEPQLSAAPHGRHHDGCEIPALPPLSPALALPRLPALAAVAADTVTLPRLPDIRGPPVLGYAPKTSPPRG